MTDDDKQTLVSGWSEDLSFIRECMRLGIDMERVSTGCVLHIREYSIPIQITAKPLVQVAAMQVVIEAVYLHFATVEPSMWNDAVCKGVHIDVAQLGAWVTDIPYWRYHLQGRVASSGRSYAGMGGVSALYSDHKGFARCVVREETLFSQKVLDPRWPVLHELAHLLFFHCIPPTDWRPGGYLDRLYWSRMIHNQIYANRYAAQNPQEYEAESITMLIINSTQSAWLHEHDPAVSTFLHQFFPQERIDRAQLVMDNQNIS